MLYQPRRLLRLTSWSGQDKRLSIPTNIWLLRGDKAGCTCGSRGFFKLAEPLVVRLSKKLWEAAAENLRVLMEDRAI